jgi:hypothetical protein
MSEDAEKEPPGALFLCYQKDHDRLREIFVAGCMIAGHTVVPGVQIAFAMNQMLLGMANIAATNAEREDVFLKVMAQLRREFTTLQSQIELQRKVMEASMMPQAPAAKLN